MKFLLFMVEFHGKTYDTDRSRKLEQVNLAVD
jgi:hypothetical protein